jgi:putative SOS response-associated peptidase YedK
MPVILMTD